MKLSTKVDECSKNISFKDIKEELSKAVTLIGIKLAEIHQAYDFDEIVTLIGNSLDNLSDVIINIGCDAKYVTSYKKWGDYGWTISPQVDKKFFITLPTSLQDADETMRRFCNIKNIKEIIEILSAHGVNSTDLEIAQYCFEKGQYKPCAMMLFSMIDCHLIDEKVFGEGKDGKPYLKTGFGVIAELKEHSEKIFSEDDFLCLLQYKLIIHSLMSLFDSKNKNFEKEPIVINRNYLMHGKSTKTITDIDCYKLWSALYSLVVAYPKLEENVKNDFN